MKQNLMKIRRHPYIVVGGILVAMAIVVALLAPILTKYDPIKTDPNNRLLPPSPTNPMGTDEYGRDVMTRVFME